MFGALKRFFSKPEEPPSPAAPPAQSAPQPARPVAPAAPVASHVAPAAPPPPPAAPAQPTPSAAAPAPAPNREGPEGTIRLPLAAIVAGLPANLAAMVVSAGSAEFSLPVKTALSQLPTGAVKISFGELRQSAPPGTFADNSTQDKTLVSLPLPIILASIDPAAMGRRSGQRVAAVPDDVTSIFGKVRPVSPSAMVHPVPSIASEPAPPPAPKPVAPATIPMPAAKPPAQEPGASPLTRQPTTPTLPKLAPKPPGAAPLPSALPKPPGAAPLPSMAPKAPASAPAPMPFAAPKPPSLAPAAPEEFLVVPISDLMESWPSPVQLEIEQFQMLGSKVSLPISRLDAAMKSGRVVFSWGELCGWLQPPPAQKPAANLEAALELPLKTIAPLFMARRQPGAAQKKINIAPQIPDIFAGVGKSPDAGIAAAPSAAPAAAVAIPAPAAPVSAMTASALGEIFGQPGKTEWTPQEIVRSICALKGVAGSVLAMGDGLLMAGQLPAPLRAETVAAFLPQIVGRVSQYSGEMQLGPVTSVLVAAGRGPCALFKTGKLYLAVLGQPGEPLPDAILAKVTAELAKRNT